MPKKTSIKVTSSTGKLLHGTAAQTRYISLHGGWDAYHEELTSNITKKVFKELMKEQQKSLFKIAK